LEFANADLRFGQEQQSAAKKVIDVNVVSFAELPHYALLRVP
jgi:hypothetical protein